MNNINLVNKIEKELVNQEKNICYIIETIERNFKSIGLKKPILSGGFCRSIFLKGNWDVIEHGYRVGIKDFDFPLNKCDYFLLKDYLINNKDQRIDIQYIGEFSINFSINESSLGYPIKIDAFHATPLCFDITSSAIAYDLYERKFIDNGCIDLLLDGKIRILLEDNEFRKHSIGLELLNIVDISLENNFEIDEELIRQLRIKDRCMNAIEESYFSKINYSFYKIIKKYDNGKQLIKSCINICKTFKLNNYLKLFDQMNSNYKEVFSKEKNILKLDDQISLSFSSYQINDLDFINICHSENFKDSVFFYMVKRTDEIKDFFEIGWHNGVDWKKEIVHVDNGERISVIVKKNKNYINVFIEIPFRNIRKSITTDDKDIFILNYDCKKNV